jgi:hypothetical protein
MSFENVNKYYYVTSFENGYVTKFLRSFVFTKEISDSMRGSGSGRAKVAVDGAGRCEQSIYSRVNVAGEVGESGVGE